MRRVLLRILGGVQIPPRRVSRPKHHNGCTVRLVLLSRLRLVAHTSGFLPEGRLRGRILLRIGPGFLCYQGRDTVKVQ